MTCLMMVSKPLHFTYVLTNKAENYFFSTFEVFINLHDL